MIGEELTFSLLLSNPGGGDGVAVVVLYTILGNVFVLTLGEQWFDLNELFCDNLWRWGYEYVFEGFEGFLLLKLSDFSITVSSWLSSEDAVSISVYTIW